MFSASQFSASDFSALRLKCWEKGAHFFRFSLQRIQLFLLPKDVISEPDVTFHIISVSFSHHFPTGLLSSLPNVRHVFVLVEQGTYRNGPHDGWARVPEIALYTQLQSDIPGGCCRLF